MGKSRNSIGIEYAITAGNAFASSPATSVPGRLATYGSRKATSRYPSAGSPSARRRAHHEEDPAEDVAGPGHDEPPERREAGNDDDHEDQVERIGALALPVVRRRLPGRSPARTSARITSDPTWTIRAHRAERVDRPIAHDDTISGAASHPETVVPPPGVDEIPTSPPNAASRSRMFCSPVPAEIAAASNPDAVVADAERDPVALAREGDADLGGLRVLRGVLHRLEADEVDRRLDLDRKTTDTVHVDLDRDARRRPCVVRAGPIPCSSSSAG